MVTRPWHDPLIMAWLEDGEPSSDFWWLEANTLFWRLIFVFKFISWPDLIDYPHLHKSRDPLEDNGPTNISLNQEL